MSVTTASSTAVYPIVGHCLHGIKPACEFVLMLAKLRPIGNDGVNTTFVSLWQHMQVQSRLLTATQMRHEALFLRPQMCITNTN